MAKSESCKVVFGQIQTFQSPPKPSAHGSNTTRVAFPSSHHISLLYCIAPLLCLWTDSQSTNMVVMKLYTPFLSVHSVLSVRY